MGTKHTNKKLGRVWRIEMPDNKVKEFVSIMTFPMPRIGWESDNLGYVVEDGGEKRIVFTSHGVPYFATEKEAKEMLTLYSEAKAGMTHAINLMKGK